MSFLRKNLLLLSLVFLVYAWFFAFHYVPQKTVRPTQNENVLGAEANVSLFVEPDAGRSQVINAINSATQKILVEVYLLSDKETIQALEDAKNRGVDVEVMLEQHPFGGGGINNTTQKELESKGIKFEWTNSAFALTHEKAIVIDDSEVFVLSQNLTSSSFSRNREFDVLDLNSRDISEVKNIFESDWQRKTFDPPSDSNLIESPDNSRTAIEDLISNATSSIDIEMEEINDPKVINLLEEKSKNIKVRIIIPSFTQLKANQKYAEELEKSGILVEILSSPYIHAKLILVDQREAYVGSINLSSQSMDENRELGILLTQPDSIVTLSSTFEKDWTNAVAN